MLNEQTHTFYLTQNVQMFRLQDVIDNLDGTKRIRVKNIAFKVTSMLPMPPKSIGRRIEAIDPLEENHQRLVL